MEYKIQVNDPSIEHHGVKGMKWGVRRKRKSSGQVSSAIRAYGWGKKYKKRSRMSNKELRETVERLRLENAFKTEMRAAKGYKVKHYEIDTGAILNKVISKAADVGVNEFVNYRNGMKAAKAAKAAKVMGSSTIYDIAKAWR